MTSSPSSSPSKRGDGFDSLRLLLSSLSTSLSSSPQPTHLQHLQIRLSRQLSSLTSSTSSTEFEENWIRLLGRIEELIEGLKEVGGMGKEVEMTEEVVKELIGLKVVRDVKELEKEREKARGGGHKREGSNVSLEELRRKLPLPTSPSSTSIPSTSSNIDEFLSSYTSTHSPFPSSSSTPNSLSSSQSKAISDALALRTLSLTPSKILPPGQTISSLFSSTSLPSSSDSLNDSHDSTNSLDSLATLSSSPPSPEIYPLLLSRIWKEVASLIPAKMDRGRTKPSLETVFSPTAESAITVGAVYEALGRLVEALARLCAPARDAEMRDLREIITSGGRNGNANGNLEKVVRNLMEFIKGMKDDLTSFREGQASSLSDNDLSAIVRLEAGRRERLVIRELFGGVEGVSKGVEEWLGRAGEGVRWEELEGKEKETLVGKKFLECLFRDEAVEVPSVPSRRPSPPPPPSFEEKEEEEKKKNILPPILVLSSTNMFGLQNGIQRVVILACLNSLVISISPSIAPSNATENSKSKLNDLLSRLSIILSSSLSDKEDKESETKLANLSDEIIASLEFSDLERKRKIQDGVQRILRYQDPVFKFLKNRVHSLLSSSLFTFTTPTSSSPPPPSIPNGIKMRTGRLPPPPQNGHTKVEEKTVKEEVGIMNVKGFENEVLRMELGELVEKVGREWEWVTRVWGSEGWK